MRWEEVLPHPSVALITGRRGAGKSALGYYLLERFHGREMDTCVMGLPKEKWGLLPDYIHPMEFNRELPEDSAIFVDEAAMGFYSRDSMRKVNKLMNTLLSVSRQRNQTILFCSHTLRKLDVGIVMDADAILLKEPSKLHANFERREIRDLTEEAWRKFDGVDDSVGRKRRVVVFSHDYWGEVLENPLPSFWSEELSRAFATIPLEEEEVEHREVLENILEIEESGDYNLDWGWTMEEVRGLNGGLIAKFLSEGLIERGLTTNTTKCFKANKKKIKERLGR